MRPSNWDYAFVFGEIIGERDGQTVVEEKIKVTVPLPLVKAMTELLTVNLAAYEKQFGEILIPRIQTLKPIYYPSTDSL